MGNFRYASALRQGRLLVILCEINGLADLIKQNEQLINDENAITQRIVEWLQNNDYRRTRPELLNYYFEREAPENSGRVDIKVMINQESFADTRAYYTIECKRLDAKNQTGLSGLNAEYIKNGICRFVRDDYYTSYFGESGMLGFVVEAMNIESNVDCINLLLNKDFIAQDGAQVNAKGIIPLTKDIFQGVPYCWSTHRKNNGSELILLHMFLDFSGIITP